MSDMAISITPAASDRIQRASGEEFDELTAAMQRYFLDTVGLRRLRLFTTDAALLDVTYLQYLDDAERQHHTCNACLRFLRTFGGLVAINEDGVTLSPLWTWSAGDLPPIYRFASNEMRRLVEKARVTGVFLSSTATCGVPVTGPWTHFAVTLPDELVFDSRVKTAGQAMAEKLEEYRMLTAALDEFPLPVVDLAVGMLKSESMYRSEKCIGAAVWLRDLHRRRNATRNERHRENMTWAAVATAPAGWCHVRSGMIGTLLTDIAAGLPAAEVRRRFAEKMNPLQYQRPQAAPTAGNIEQAEKLVAKLGIASALKRRFARIEDVRAIWKPLAKRQPAAGAGVFSHLKTQKPATATTRVIAVNPTAITWVKFAATVLPEAARIAVCLPQMGAFVGLVTACDPEAPPILQWDHASARNPVSWYHYSNGSTPEDWNLKAGVWQPVTAICLKPAHWAGPMAHHSSDAFFLLAGARDLRYKGTGNCIFPETLHAELHEVRATIEAYSKGATLEGVEEASACGIGLGKSGLIVRVTSDDGVTIAYRIDRWD